MSCLVELTKRYIPGDKQNDFLLLKCNENYVNLKKKRKKYTLPFRTQY